MNPFRYTRVANLGDAVATMRAYPKAAYLAGGTTLLDLMKEGIEQPQVVVDINNLPLAEIRGDNEGLHIGAMVSNSDLANHPLVRKHFPVLSQALLSGASGQIRNMASVGGNLLQRTRCAYFRDLALPCNKRQPDTACGAIYGYNRSHAVLGTSEHCIATHPSDMAVALTVLDATIRIVSEIGERTIPIRQFYTLPENTPHVENRLAPGDLILGVDLRWLPSCTRSVYLKVRDRASYEFALAAAAVAVALNGDRITEARIALGGVATVPWHCANAEAVLTDARASVRSFREAAEAALEGAIPRQHNSYKIELAKRTLIRALMEVTQAYA